MCLIVSSALCTFWYPAGYIIVPDEDEDFKDTKSMFAEMLILHPDNFKIKIRFVIVKSNSITFAENLSRRGNCMKMFASQKRLKNWNSHLYYVIQGPIT